MNSATCLTTAHGFRMPLGMPTYGDELQAHGMHRSDPSFIYAAAALRAARPGPSQPGAWRRLFDRFGDTPSPVALPPPALPLDIADFSSVDRHAVECLAGSFNSVGRLGVPAGVWSVLSEALRMWQARLDPPLPDSLATLTLALQQLGEQQVDRLEAAAWYALTMHAGWRAAGVVFLSRYRNTWAADWIAERPEYRRLAAIAADEFGDVPAWLYEPRN